MADDPRRPAPPRRRPPWLGLGLLALVLAGVVAVFVFADDDELLVVAPRDVDALVADADPGDALLVRGTVRRLRSDDHLVNSAALDRYEGQAVIVATEVRRAADEERDGDVTVEEVAGDGDALIGRQVTLVAALDEELGGPFFTLEDD